MTNSSCIVGLLGPTLIAIAVAGLAIVRAHNYWTRGWPVLITLVGWIAMLSGLSRMAAPVAAQEAGQHPTVVYASLVALLVIGAVLIFKAYGRREGPVGQRPERPAAV